MSSINEALSSASSFIVPVILSYSIDFSYRYIFKFFYEELSNNKNGHVLDNEFELVRFFNFLGLIACSIFILLNENLYSGLLPFLTVSSIISLVIYVIVLVLISLSTIKCKSSDNKTKDKTK